MTNLLKKKIVLFQVSLKVDQNKMMEFARHFLGVCGEHWHLNIWHIPYILPMVLPYMYYMKYRFNKKNV